MIFYSSVHTSLKIETAWLFSHYDVLGRVLFIFHARHIFELEDFILGILEPKFEVSTQFLA